MSDAKPVLINSVSGLRGIVGTSLTVEKAMQFACATGRLLSDLSTEAKGPIRKRIVIARDSRPSGPLLNHVVSAGLMAMGVDVIEAGIASTPTVGVLVRQLKTIGAIQITASHNPREWNGMKVFSSDGRVLTADLADHLSNHFSHLTTGKETLQTFWSPVDELGIATDYTDPHQPHLDLLLDTINPECFQPHSLHVVLDSNHGVGSILGTRLLEKFGCRTTCLGQEPDGDFSHPPEPLEPHLRDLCRLVSEQQADVGFALDPDGDRLAVVDNKGHYIGEEYTLALAVDHLLSRKKGSVVTNVSTTQAIDDIARKYGCPCFRTKVGEAHVVERMIAESALVGGEGNGGVIDPRIGLVRDGFIAMGIILDLLQAGSQTLHECVKRLPQYYMVKDKVEMDTDLVDPLFEYLKKGLLPNSIDQTDGYRFQWDRAWVHIRPSNTEAIVRVLAEAPTKTEAQRLASQARYLLLEKKNHG